MILDGQEVFNSLDENELTFFNDAVLCKQAITSVNKSWILFENQFTVEVF